jgi:uncharacterized protein YkwD
MPSATARTLLLIALLPALHVQAAPDAAPQLEADIRSLTLKQTRKQPAALTRDEVLAAIARAHSETMYGLDELAHEVHEGVGPADRLARHHRTLFGLVSENVAVRKRGSPDANVAKRLVDGWMKSPGHRANILAPYDTFEVGCYGDQKAMYCTQLFVQTSLRLASGASFQQRTGAVLTLELGTAARNAHVERRFSIAAVDAAPVDTGVVVNGGSAQLTLPDRPGLYQLKLWTQMEDDPSRYRIVGGPYVRTVTGSAPAQSDQVSSPDQIM